jgi:hypothetical protein
MPAFRRPRRSAVLPMVPRKPRSHYLLSPAFRNSACLEDPSEPLPHSRPSNPRPLSPSGCWKRAVWGSSHQSACPAARGRRWRSDPFWRSPARHTPTGRPIREELFEAPTSRCTKRLQAQRPTLRCRKNRRWSTEAWLDSSVRQGGSSQEIDYPTLSRSPLRIHLGSKPRTVAKGGTTGFARAFRRACDSQQRCRLR